MRTLADEDLRRPEATGDDDAGLSSLGVGTPSPPAGKGDENTIGDAFADVGIDLGGLGRELGAFATLLPAGPVKDCRLVTDWLLGREPVLLPSLYVLLLLP